MNPTTSDKIFKVTSQGNLRVLIDPFVVMATAGVIRYGGGFVDCADNASGFVVVDSSTGVASVTSDPLDLTKVYLCSVQASQGVARVIDQYENSPWVAADYGGGGGGAAPEVIAPFPGIGAEGTYYAQQVRTTGNTPQTFATTSGTLPTGWSLASDTGIISGTSLYPLGGLYNGTITVTNSSGSVDYNYSILLTGEIPEIGYTTGPFNSITYPLVSGDIVVTALSEFTVSPSTATGSSGGDPAIPISYSGYTPGYDVGLTCNIESGDLSITSDPDFIGNVYDYLVTAVNYFGQDITESKKLAVVAPIYYGEWHGALPGTFTASNITEDLYDDTTPGPRVIEGTGVWDTFSDYGVPVWPDTGVAYYRVIALPRGLLSGTIARTTNGGGETVAPTNYATLTLSDFSPPWPDTYQSPLTIGGIDYDIYVLDGGPTTSGYTMVWRAGVSPGGPILSSESGALQFLMYAGDPNFRFEGAEDTQNTEIQLVLTSDLPVTYSTSGSLPAGLSWVEGTLTISGTPTSNDDVFERFVFTVTASNDYGSSSVTVFICISAPIYFGELPGALPGSFTASDITVGLETDGVAGPSVYPNSVVHGRPPGTYTMSTPAVGFDGIVLPGFYGHGDNATAYYPAIFYFSTFTSGYGNPDPPQRIIAVPTKFFSGSWAKDPWNTGANYRYYLYVGSGVPMPTFTPASTSGPGGNQYLDENPPYQSGLVIPSNGVNVSYIVLVCQPYINIYGYASALKFNAYNDV